MLRRAITLAVAGLISTSAISAYAQQTTLKLGIPGNWPDAPPVSYSISTSQIDPVLQSISSSYFGSNYTANKSNQIIASINNFQTQIASDIRTFVLNSDSKIKSVNPVTIYANPITARFQSLNGTVKVTFAGISAHISGRADGIAVICPTLNFSFDINKIELPVIYDYATGNYKSSNISYLLQNVSSSCSGGLSILGNLFNSVFGVGNDNIKNSINSALNVNLGAGNLRTSFNISDFMTAFNNYTSSITIPTQAQKAIQVINHTIGDISLITAGLQLDVSLTRGAANEISFLASHQASDVIHLEPIYGGTQIFVSNPINSAGIDLFLQASLSNSWGLMESLSPGNTWTEVGPLAINSKIVALAKSGVISGLYALPGAQQRQTFDATCYGNDCPEIP